MKRACAIVLVLCAACGGAPGPTTTTPPPTINTPPRPTVPSDPTRLFASDTYLMARVDVQAARRSPHWDQIADLLIRSIGDSDGTRLLRALSTKADLLLVGVAPALGGGDDRVVALIEGADLEPDISAAVSEGGSPVAPTMVRGLRVFAAHGVAAAQVDARDWILVTDTDLGTVLDAASGTGPGPTDLQLRAIADRAGFTQGTGVIATRVTDDVRALAQQAPLDSLRGIGDARYLAGRIDLAGGVHVVGTADMPSPESAIQLASALSNELANQAHGILASMFGLSPILSRAAVHATGTRVDGEDSIADDELTALLGRLGSMLRMAGGGAP